MNLQRNHRVNGRLHVWRVACTTRPWGGALVFLEITVATVSVVGLFDAACQPFGWQSALQFLAFALLGALLWFADATLETDEASVTEDPRRDSNIQPSARKTGQRKNGSDVGHRVKM